MKKRKQQIFMFLVILAAVFWLGGINIRAMIGNEFFEKGTIVLRTDLSPDFERALILVYANSTLVTLSAYLVVLISAIGYLLSTRPNLKEKGWMMIAVILFFIFVPVEIYTGYLDFKYILLYFFYSGEGYQFRELLIKRVTAIGGLSAIAIFCYYTIIGVLVWKPFNKKITDDTEK